MSKYAPLHVPQGDDHPLHITVRNASDGQPKDLTNWKAFIVVREDKRIESPVLFTYDSDTDPLNIFIDPDQTGPLKGGINILFAGTDIAEANVFDPDYYRVKIYNLLYQAGRTVRHGEFIVDDT